MEHIFTLWPSMAAIAKDIGCPYPTVAAWRQRRSIPARYDMLLVASAHERGIGLTLEQIAQARSDSYENRTGVDQ